MVKKLEDYCVTENYTIKEVMEVLQRIKERGVIILDENRKVCGVLSQGDIINALADGKNMYSQIGRIYSKEYIYLNETERKRAFQIFKNKNLCLCP